MYGCRFLGAINVLFRLTLFPVGQAVLQLRVALKIMFAQLMPTIRSVER